MVDKMRMEPHSRAKDLIAASVNLRASGLVGGVKYLSVKGFTLVELMVTVTIFGVLSTIAIGGWNSLRDSNKVEAAAASLRSALIATRIRAMSTGRDQHVTINFVANGAAAADTIATTLRSRGTLTGNVVVGAEKSFDRGVDWINGMKQGNPSVCVPGTTADAFKTIKFRGRGTANTLPANKTRTLIVRDMQGLNRFCIEVNNVTGRVKLTRL